MHHIGCRGNPKIMPGLTNFTEKERKMAIGTQVIRELLENGVHFGHQTNKWNPKMAKYIFGEKSGIYIIDLKKTEQALANAKELVKKLASEGKKILFAGTKKQAKTIIKEEAERSHMYYVEERWLGGCLTNFKTIRQSVNKLNKLQELKESDTYDSYAKKDKARIDKEEAKLLKNLSGIREMLVLPDAIVVVDAEVQEIAIKEAHIIGIPVIALIDTNCNPEGIEFPVPGNDDAIRSIQYIISSLADAIIEGSKGYDGVKVKKAAEEKKEEAKEESKEEKKEESKEEKKEEEK